MEDISRVVLPAITPSLNCESYDLNEWFSSFCNENIIPMNRGSFNDLMEITPSSTRLGIFAPDVQEDRISPSLDTFSPSNQMQADSTEANSCVDLGSQFLQLNTQSAFSVNKSARKIPGISMSCDDCSVLTSMQLQWPVEMGTQESPNVLIKRASAPVSCRTSERDSSSATFNDTRESIDMEMIIQQACGRPIENQDSVSLVNVTVEELREKETSLDRLPGEFKLGEFATDLFSCNLVDELSEWFAPTMNIIGGITNTVIENVLQSAGITSTFNVDGDGILGMSFKKPVPSLKSSKVDSNVSGECQSSVIANSVYNNLLEGLELEFWHGQSGYYWEDLFNPVMGGRALDINSSVSKCISELDVGSKVGPRKGLSSELGIEELLDGSSDSTCLSKSSTVDQLSTVKKRRIETSTVNDNQVKSVTVSCSNDITRQHVDNWSTENNLLSNKEVFPKSQVGLWIDDRYSTSTHNTVLEKPKKFEEQTKAIKRRTRPGESTRPRPKDRQQIQDRIKELRGIIPDSSKCSIDTLLDHTIRHMLFLQSVTKYTEKFKQTDELKLLGQETITSTKGNIRSSGGAMWALEIGDQTMACPIIVEDLGPAGLILIEMLCEDRGLFLEIADAIRGFGLNIWKGVMAKREDKIWARFIVEGNTRITRVEIFLFLLELLHQIANQCDGLNKST